MRVTRGFTLIELLIYLVLLAGLTWLTFGFAARTYRFMLERTQEHHAFVRLMVTEDLIRRDVQCASMLPHDWVTARQVFKQLTMTDDGKPIERWIGYEVTDKGLVRREGVYQVTTGTWSDSGAAALINVGVTTINLNPIVGTRGTVVGVTVTITTKSGAGVKVNAMTVALRNRVLS